LKSPSPPTDREPKPAQVPFLESLRLGETAITVYLVNGVRLGGTIADYDDYTIRLSGGQLVMKSAICSVVAAPLPNWR
jgi:RNA chaperone Hfq